MSDLAVTEHAIGRYKERVKPALDWSAAKTELLALIAMAPAPSPTPPQWLAGTQPDTEGWLELADGIVGVVAGGRVTTVMTRGGANSQHRALKMEQKRVRRAMRKKRVRIYSGLERKGVEPRTKWR